MKNYFIITTLLLALTGCGSMLGLKKNRNMKNMEFTPAIFGKIDYKSMETEICPCSPDISKEFDKFLSTLKISVPEKVFLHPTDEEFVPFLPLCMAYGVSPLRRLKYHNFSEKMIHIKPENEDSEHIGYYFIKASMNFIQENPLSYLTAEGLRQRKQRIEEAQKLRDDELDRDIYSGNILNSFSNEYLNINALDFVYIPIRTGKYEIWVTHYGMESNHAIVDIVVEGDKTVINSFSTKSGTSKVINHSVEEAPTNIEEEELPEI